MLDLDLVHTLLVLGASLAVVVAVGTCLLLVQALQVQVDREIQDDLQQAQRFLIRLTDTVVETVSTLAVVVAVAVVELVLLELLLRRTLLVVLVVQEQMYLPSSAGLRSTKAVVEEEEHQPLVAQEAHL